LKQFKVIWLGMRALNVSVHSGELDDVANSGALGGSNKISLNAG
jgi:hypothetical protein